MSEATIALMITAATVGSLHSLAPDHWVPFAALARARNWTLARTSRLAFFCGFGHVTVSALLAIGAVLAGRSAIESFGATLQSTAPMLLIAFGLVYMTWGLWRTLGRRLVHDADHLEGIPHDHGHGHVHHHHHGGSGATEWSLFLLFCADPCIALIPMIVAASTQGWNSILMVVLVYEVATILSMIVLVATASAGARHVRFAWVDRYGDALAGALIVVLGAVVIVVGI
jgi:nickel/cobalt exporter